MGNGDIVDTYRSDGPCEKRLKWRLRFVTRRVSEGFVAGNSLTRRVVINPG